MQISSKHGNRAASVSGESWLLILSLDSQTNAHLLSVVLQTPISWNVKFNDANLVRTTKLVEYAPLLLIRRNGVVWLGPNIVSHI